MFKQFFSNIFIFNQTYFTYSHLQKLVAATLIMTPHFTALISLCQRPLSADRQHLSYGVCLEVRGEIIRTVLCCIVYDSCAQS